MQLLTSNNDSVNNKNNTDTNIDRIDHNDNADSRVTDQKWTINKYTSNSDDEMLILSIKNTIKSTIMIMTAKITSREIKAIRSQREVIKAIGTGRRQRKQEQDPEQRTVIIIFIITGIIMSLSCHHYC